MMMMKMMLWLLFVLTSILMLRKFLLRLMLIAMLLLCVMVEIIVTVRTGSQNVQVCEWLHFVTKLGGGGRDNARQQLFLRCCQV